MPYETLQEAVRALRPPRRVGLPITLTKRQAGIPGKRWAGDSPKARWHHEQSIIRILRPRVKPKPALAPAVRFMVPPLGPRPAPRYSKR